MAASSCARACRGPTSVTGSSVSAFQRLESVPHDPTCEDFADAVHAAVMTGEQVVAPRGEHGGDREPHARLERDKLAVVGCRRCCSELL